MATKTKSKMPWDPNARAPRYGKQKEPVKKEAPLKQKAKVRASDDQAHMGRSLAQEKKMTNYGVPGNTGMESKKSPRYPVAKPVAKK